MRRRLPRRQKPLMTHPVVSAALSRDGCVSGVLCAASTSPLSLSSMLAGHFPNFSEKRRSGRTIWRHTHTVNTQGNSSRCARTFLSIAGAAADTHAFPRAEAVVVVARIPPPLSRCSRFLRRVCRGSPMPGRVSRALPGVRAQLGVAFRPRRGGTHRPVELP